MPPSSASAMTLTLAQTAPFLPGLGINQTSALEQYRWQSPRVPWSILSAKKVHTCGCMECGVEGEPLRQVTLLWLLQGLHRQPRGLGKHRAVVLNTCPLGLAVGKEIRENIFSFLSFLLFYVFLLKQCVLIFPLLFYIFNLMLSVALGFNFF